MRPSFGEVRDEVRRKAPLMRALAELDGALDGGGVQELCEGQLSACDALAMFTRRHFTTQQASIETAGLPEIVQALQIRDPDETILLFHFASASRLFTIATSTRGEIVGGIRVALAPPEAPGDEPSSI